MGVDFACILDVAVTPRDVLDLPPEVLELPRRLDRLNDELARIWCDINRHCPRKKWEADLEPAMVGADRTDELDLSSPLQVVLAGPHWFSAAIFRQTVSFSHVTRWKFFLNDAGGLHDLLLRSCRLFANALGATRLLYLPDLGEEELCEKGVQDQPFDRLLSHLHGVWGPPSPWRPPYPMVERYWEVYFVEHLAIQR